MNNKTRKSTTRMGLYHCSCGKEVYEDAIGARLPGCHGSICDACAVKYLKAKLIEAPRRASPVLLAFPVEGKYDGEYLSLDIVKR